MCSVRLHFVRQYLCPSGTTRAVIGQLSWLLYSAHDQLKMGRDFSPRSIKCFTRCTHAIS